MEGLILTGIIAYSHPHLQGIQVILLFIYIGCTMIKFITLFFKSDISGLHILHSRADLPPARRLPSCLCVSCSQRQTRIWFPSSSPHELELWRECQDSQKEITTGKSNLMQNLQKYLHLHNAQTPPFNHRSCSCQEQTCLSQPARPDPVNGHSSQSTSILVFHCLFPRIWLPPTSPQTDKTSVVEISSVSTRIHKCRWHQPSTMEVQAATNLLFPNWKPQGWA